MSAFPAHTTRLNAAQYPPYRPVAAASPARRRGRSVPAPASIYAYNGQLYILSAPLNVLMETQYLKLRGVRAVAVCPQQQHSTEASTPRSADCPGVVGIQSVRVDEFMTRALRNHAV